MLSLPNPYLWLALIIALAGLYGAHRYVVVTESRQAVAVAVAKANEQARKTEDELRQNELALRKDKDAEIKRISVERDKLANSLRSRPKRADIATPGSPSCTGRELYQEDGIFLIGEAARAEELIAERNYYYQLYEDARKKLNGR